MEDRQDALAASIARRFKLAVRIHRGSRRKRPTRRNLREARRAQIAKVLPDAVEELRAQGLWIPPEPEVKAHANAYADELADRSYSDRVVTMRPHDSPAAVSRTEAVPVIAGRAQLAPVRLTTTAQENHRQRRAG